MALGKTLTEIEAMPERHLKEYELYYQEQPFGLWREDYRNAQVLQLLANINRMPKTEPHQLKDFMPFFNDIDEKQEDDGVSDYLEKR